MDVATVRARVPFPTSPRRHADFLLCTISSWTELDNHGNPVDPAMLPGQPRTEHVIVEFDVDKGTDACIYLQAEWDKEGEFIVHLFDGREFVPFIPVCDSSKNEADEPMQEARPDRRITESRTFTPALLSGRSQSQVARQRLAVAFAHSVMMKGTIPGSALRQPGEKTSRGKRGLSDQGKGTGWSLPVSSSWRTHRSSSLLVDVQNVAAGNDKFAIYQDALDSFSSFSGSSFVTASQDKCKGASIFDIARCLQLRRESGPGNQGYTYTAKGNLTGRNGTERRDLGNVLVTQGRAALFDDPPGVPGVVVILSAAPIVGGDDGETTKMEVKGVVWKDCVRNRGGQKLSSPPKPLTKCVITTVDGGFEIEAAELFKHCTSLSTASPAAPTFRNMSRDKVKCSYIQAHGSPFDNDSNLKLYLPD